MNTVDCIKTRRSVRKFTEEKVPHEVLEQLVELSRWAPSWKNTQIARYVAVEDEALKSRIAEEATIPWNEGIIKGAPVLMVMTYVEKRSGFERDGSFSTTKGDRWQNFDCGVAAAALSVTAAFPPPRATAGRTLTAVLRRRPSGWRRMSWDWAAWCWASLMKRSWPSCWSCRRAWALPA